MIIESVEKANVELRNNYENDPCQEKPEWFQHVSRALKHVWPEIKFCLVIEDGEYMIKYRLREYAGGVRGYLREFTNSESLPPCGKKIAERLLDSIAWRLFEAAWEKEKK